MSFATEVKKELLRLEYNDEALMAFVTGIMQDSSSIIIKEGKMMLRVQSFMPSIIRFLVPFLKTKYDAQTETSYLDKTNINKKRIYCLEILDKVDEIIKDMSLSFFDSIKIDSPILKTDKAKKAFVSGCFLSKGSISDPRKSSYHLEILFRKQDNAYTVMEILGDNGIVTSNIQKKNQTLVYIKRSETISNFLAFIDAYSGVLEFEDLRIRRYMNNEVNRAMNCDISNYKKSLEYCNKQLQAIKYIKDRELDAKLSQRLKDAMKLREAYPDSTLSELSELSENILGKHLSKSGVSHCMKEIMDYYNNLTNSKLN